MTTTPSASQARALEALSDARIRALPQDLLCAEAARVAADVEMAPLLGGGFAPVWSAVTAFAAHGYLSARQDEQLRRRLRRFRAHLQRHLDPPGR